MREQIKVEYGQLQEMATASGAPLLGNALVVVFDSTDSRDKRCGGLPFHHCKSIEVDYQNVPEQRRSKGVADTIYTRGLVRTTKIWTSNRRRTPQGRRERPALMVLCAPLRPAAV